MDCRGTVFDPPCPSSFTREDRVVGNLAIDADPMFGGGHLLAAGLSTDGEAFELILNDELLSIVSGGDTRVAAGSSRAKDTPGGAVQLTAGDGTHLHGGQGGPIRLVAGDGYGQAAYNGDLGDGGAVELLGGMTFEGVGGGLDLRPGLSFTSTGGGISLVSGLSARSASGAVLIATANSGSEGTSGAIRLATGDALARPSGSVSLATGASTASRAGDMVISPGMAGRALRLNCT